MSASAIAIRRDALRRVVLANRPRLAPGPPGFSRIPIQERPASRVRFASLRLPSTPAGDLALILFLLAALYVTSAPMATIMPA